VANPALPACLAGAQSGIARTTTYSPAAQGGRCLRRVFPCFLVLANKTFHLPGEQAGVENVGSRQLWRAKLRAKFLEGPACVLMICGSSISRPMANACSRSTRALAGSPQFSVGQARFPRAAALPAPVADLTENDQRPARSTERLPHLAQVCVAHAQVAQGLALPRRSPLSRAISSRRSWYPIAFRTSPRSCRPHPGSRGCYPPRAGRRISRDNHQRLLVVPDRLRHLAQVCVGHAQVAQGVALPVPVRDLTEITNACS